MPKIHKIAIDGPAGVGKSTTAAAVAHALNFTHINSGELYRAITHIFLQKYDSTKEQLAHGLSPAQQQFLPTIELALHDGVLTWRGAPCELRTPQVVRFVSYMARIREVREHVHRIQTGLTRDVRRGVVMDGRDICSVVMPDADLKVFMTASAETRAVRRLGEQTDVSADDMKVNDMKVNDMKVNDVKVNDVKVNDVKVNDVKVNDMKVNDMKVNDVKVNANAVSMNTSTNTSTSKNTNTNTSKNFNTNTNEQTALQKTIEDINRRDSMDMNRKHGPLIKTEDAFEVRNDDMSFEEQVRLIVKEFRKRTSGKK